MSKLLVSLFGIFTYLVGLAGLTAFMLYLGGWSFLPLHINSQPLGSAGTQAILINLLIILLFGLHHSLAARSSFKKKLTQIVPAAVERSIYVLISGLFMFAFCLYWQPIAGKVWHTDNQVAVIILRALHVFGWLILVLATFEIDLFHLMELKQSLSMNPDEDHEFNVIFLYKIARFGNVYVDYKNRVPAVIPFWPMGKKQG
ncbi:hypothetical protein [Pseudoalteromonas qingdaonensis]|uniref:hypothetical protein n=1 Tax=Pseudoalteromonas qingdaonensis TaxID=3131913 RepID=UPI00316AC8E1